MIDDDLKYKFLDFAKEKGKVRWSDMKVFFGEDFFKSNDLDYILRKLDKSGIRVFNDMPELLKPEEKKEDIPVVTAQVLRDRMNSEIEDATINLAPLLDKVIANGNVIRCSEIQKIVGTENAVMDKKRFDMTVKIMLGARISIPGLEVDEKGSFKFPFSFDDAIFNSYDNFKNPTFIDACKRFGKMHVDADGGGKYNSEFRTYIADAVIDNGFDIDYIRTNYKISEDVIRDWIFVTKNGYDPMEPYYALEDEDLISEIKRMKRQGYSNEEVAVQFEIYPSTLKRILNDGSWHLVEEEEADSLRDRLAKSYN